MTTRHATQRRARPGGSSPGWQGGWRDGGRRYNLLLALAIGLALVGQPAAVALDGEASGVTFHSRLFTGIPHDVVVDGTTAYVALDTGVHVYDVTDPGSPVRVGHLYLPSPALDLDLAGSILYVANGESGLQVVDVSIPAAPSLLGSLPTAGTRGVAVQGDYAYLAEASGAADGIFGLRVVVVTDPASPAGLAFQPLPNGALAVAVQGATAYVGVGSEMSLPEFGLYVINVATPNTPVAVGWMPTSKPVLDVEVSGGLAYLGTGFPFSGALITADVSTPSAPFIRSDYALDDAVQSVSVAFDTVYAACRSLGLLSFDLSDPTVPAPADGLPTGRETWGVMARGDTAFLAERSSMGQASFTVVDTPAAPGRLAEIFFSPYAEAMDAAVSPGLAYLLRRDALHIMDSTDPSTLSPLSVWAPPGADLTAVDAAFPLVAVAHGTWVRLLDLTNPLVPVERGVVTVSSGYVVDVVLDGDALFVANGRGFETFDITDPNEPGALGTYDTASGATFAIAVDGGRAYLAAGNTLEIVDVSAPATPTVLGSLPLTESLFGVAAEGDVAVLTGLGNYLLIVDVSSPANPTLVGALGEGSGFDVTLEDQVAFVAAAEEGLVVVDVSVPDAPSVLGLYDASGTASGVAVQGTSVFLATVEAQHWVLGCDSCAPGCLVSLDIESPDPDVCEGEQALLFGANIIESGCPGGLLEFQWFEDGIVIPGADQAMYVVPRTQSPGRPQYWLEARCQTDPSCVGLGWIDVSITPESWPTLTPNSLRVTKADLQHTLTWGYETGGGEANVHRSLVAADLSALPPDMSTFIAASPGTTYSSTLPLPPGGVAFYRVHPRKSCSGDSAPF